MPKINVLMQHSIGANTKNNASRLSMNSVQGHYHSEFAISYVGDPKVLRWSMSVGCLMDMESPSARYAEGMILKRFVLGCGVIIGEDRNILIVPDLHMPYVHKDAFRFLQAVQKAYKTKETLCVGDLIDHHSGSYHETEPDAYSPAEEYRRAKKQMKQLQALFPKMVISYGNHDEIAKRKLRTVGLAADMVSDYNALYKLKPGWLWKKKHVFNCKNARPVLIPMTLGSGGRWIGRII